VRGKGRQSAWAATVMMSCCQPSGSQLPTSKSVRGKLNDVTELCGQDLSGTRLRSHRLDGSLRDAVGAARGQRQRLWKRRSGPAGASSAVSRATGRSLWRGR